MISYGGTAILLTEYATFDQIIDRRGTNSIKWDHADCCPGRTDILPMWVADMDFAAPRAVIDAASKAVEHGIFGYCGLPDSALESVADWCADRYGWPIDTTWLSYTSGVITGLNIAIQTFTRPGESIIIQPPVYPPFHASVRSNGRKLVYNHLAKEDDGSFVMDIQALRSSVTDDTKMIVLCNPHNPVGRAWSKSELTAVAEVAEEHDLLVFSDEIHADLLLPPNRHTSFASLSPEIAQRTITGIAPSKTFNIAGLKASIIITPNERLRADFDRAQEKTFGLYHANTFAVVAMEAAYRYGAEWLDRLMGYLAESRDEAVRFLRERVPSVTVAPPEATFLLWLDFSRAGGDNDEIKRKLCCDAGVLLNDGRSFGPGGDYHFRFNFGCPRSVMRDGLERIAEVFGERG